MKLASYFFTASLVLMAMLSCSKNSPAPKPTYPIDGLWIGTYTFNAQPPLFFSFTIYPDGTMTYKSSGSGGVTFYATGTWTLTDTVLNYQVTILNNPGGVESSQQGTATFNSSAGTLTNGVNSDSITGASSVFTMKRDN